MVITQKLAYQTHGEIKEVSLCKSYSKLKHTILYTLDATAMRVLHFPLHADVHFHWDEHDDLQKYIVSLYWAVTTISSVG